MDALKRHTLHVHIIWWFLLGMAVRRGGGTLSARLGSGETLGKPSEKRAYGPTAVPKTLGKAKLV